MISIEWGEDCAERKEKKRWLAKTVITLLLACFLCLATPPLLFVVWLVTAEVPEDFDQKSASRVVARIEEYKKLHGPYPQSLHELEANGAVIPNPNWGRDEWYYHLLPDGSGFVLSVGSGKHSALFISGSWQYESKKRSWWFTDG